jgi:hypothetical protein
MFPVGQVGCADYPPETRSGLGLLPFMVPGWAGMLLLSEYVTFI